MQKNSINAYACWTIKCLHNKFADKLCMPMFHIWDRFFFVTYAAVFACVADFSRIYAIVFADATAFKSHMQMFLKCDYF